MKTEQNAFGSILNASELDVDFSKDIDNIIDNLGDDMSFDMKGADKDNVSVNSESLLNDSMQDRGNDSCDRNVNDYRSNDNDDNSNSQPLLISNANGDSVSVFNISKTDRDNNSTDCETETEDRDDDAIASDKFELSGNENGVSNTDCTKDTGSVGYRETLDDDKIIQDSGVVSKKSESFECNLNTEKRVNGEAIDQSKVIDDDQLMRDLDEQIGEGDSRNGDIVDDKLTSLSVCSDFGDRSGIDEESNKNDDKILKELSNGREREFPSDGTVTTHINENETFVGNSTSANFNTDTNRENSIDTTNDRSELNNDDESQTMKDRREENEALCNDIENKINDLITMRNSESNDWDNDERNGADSTVNNERLLENGDRSEYNGDVTGSNGDLSRNNDDPSENNGRAIENNGNSSQNHENTNDNNDGSTDVHGKDTENKDVDGDKISLEDLLPPKDSQSKSMDLDSISDEDYNFDA